MKGDVFSKYILNNLSVINHNITANGRNACKLTISVIFLTATVLGVAQPLMDAKQKLADESKFMRKEIVAYKKFSAGEERQARQQQIELQQLKIALPEHVDAEQLVKQVYRKAELNGVVIQKLKRILNTNDNNQSKGKNRTEGFLTWDVVFSGSWEAIMAFLNNIENQEPMTRLTKVHICRLQKSSLISVQAQMCVSYFPGK